MEPIGKLERSDGTIRVRKTDDVEGQVKDETDESNEEEPEEEKNRAQPKDIEMAGNSKKNCYLSDILKSLKISLNLETMVYYLLRNDVASENFQERTRAVQLEVSVRLYLSVG